MKVVGLIAEYNPFHNGHVRHMQMAKALTGADYCIVVMSGHYVQRGEPACMDKYLRTDAALRSGADLVIELPVAFATGSAELFAAGAVSIFDKLGIVDSLCFGSESGDLEKITSVAKILAEEPEALSVRIKKLLAKGLSYPAARSQALVSYLADTSEGVDLEQIPPLLSAPNNILGIEYVKALERRRSAIRPVTLKRTSDYLSKALQKPYCSSSAIRHILLSGPAGTIGPMTQTLKNVRSCVPEESYQLMTEHFNRKYPVSVDDFSSVLVYKLLSSRNADLTDYVDISPDLENRIKGCLTEAAAFSDLIDAVKCRQYTRTRISRALLHLLLDIKTVDMALYKANDYVSYARILGFKKSAEPLLRKIKKNSSIPMITKLSNAERQLSEAGLYMLNQEVFASNLYQSVVYHKFGYRMKNEYTEGILVR